MLTKESEYIYNNLRKNFINIKIKKSVFLDNILSIIKKTKKNYYSDNCISSFSVLNNDNKKTLNNLFEKNPFISDNIKNNISKKIYYLKLMFDDAVINMYLPPNANTEYFGKEHINKLFHILIIMKHLSKKQVPVTINIYYGNLKKVIDNNKKLTVDNINSGSTHRNVEITIWRQEELYKVLFHELIHFYELDFYYDIGISYFYDKFGTKNMKLYEAYTDSLAVIIHTLFTSVYLNVSYTQLLNIEINFVLFQAGKILNLHNVSNLSDIKFKINNDVPILSYYIVKSFLLFSFDSLVEFFQKNINFNDRDYDFMTLIIKSQKNYDYNISLNKYVVINKKLTDGIIKNTMRMTVLQLI